MQNISQLIWPVASAEPLETRLAAWTPQFNAFGRLQRSLLHTRFDLPATPGYAGVYTDNKNPVEYVIARQTRGAR